MSAPPNQVPGTGGTRPSPGYDYISQNYGTYNTNLRTAQRAGIDIDRLSPSQQVEVAKQVATGEIKVASGTPVLQGSQAAQVQQQILKQQNAANYNAANQRLVDLGFRVPGYTPEPDQQNFLVYQQTTGAGTKDQNTGRPSTPVFFDLTTGKFEPETQQQIINSQLGAAALFNQYQASIQNANNITQQINQDIQNYNIAAGKINSIFSSINSGQYPSIKLTDKDINTLADFGITGIFDRKGSLIASTRDINALADFVLGKDQDASTVQPRTGSILNSVFPFQTDRYGNIQPIRSSQIQVQITPPASIKQQQQENSSSIPSVPQPENPLIDFAKGIYSGAYDFVIPFTHLFSRQVPNTVFNSSGKVVSSNQNTGYQANLENDIAGTGIKSALELYSTGKIGPDIPADLQKIGQNVIANPFYTAGNLAFSAATWFGPGAAAKFLDIARQGSVLQKAADIVKANLATKVSGGTDLFLSASIRAARPETSIYRYYVNYDNLPLLKEDTSDFINLHPIRTGAIEDPADLKKITEEFASAPFKQSRFTVQSRPSILTETGVKPPLTADEELGIVKLNPQRPAGLGSPFKQESTSIIEEKRNEPIVGEFTPYNPAATKSLADIIKPDLWQGKQGAPFDLLKDAGVSTDKPLPSLADIIKPEKIAGKQGAPFDLLKDAGVPQNKVLKNLQDIIKPDTGNPEIVARLAAQRAEEALRKQNMQGFRLARLFIRTERGKRQAGENFSDFMNMTEGKNAIEPARNLLSREEQGRLANFKMPDINRITENFDTEIKRTSGPVSGKSAAAKKQKEKVKEKEEEEEEEKQAGSGLVQIVRKTGEEKVQESAGAGAGAGTGIFSKAKKGRPQREEEILGFNAIPPGFSSPKTPASGSNTGPDSNSDLFRPGYITAGKIDKDITSVFNNISNITTGNTPGFKPGFSATDVNLPEQGTNPFFSTNTIQKNNTIPNMLNPASVTDLTFSSSTAPVQSVKQTQSFAFDNPAPAPAPSANIPSLVFPGVEKMPGLDIPQIAINSPPFKLSPITLPDFTNTERRKNRKKGKYKRVNILYGVTDPLAAVLGPSSGAGKRVQNLFDLLDI